jgi:FkbM family methyltransferase
VGGNDGILSDPVVSLAQKHDWVGAVLEPIPAYFQALRRTYRDHPNVECLNLAVDTMDGERTMYVANQSIVEAQRDGDGDYWLQGIASFYRSHLREHGLEEGEIECVTVKTVRGSTLVEGLGLGDCDALIVDVEGAECSVIESFDLPHWRPRCILFESEHLRDSQRSTLEDLLVSCGYQVHWNRPDSFALLAESTVAR